jgi:hypothetical protein
VSTEEDEDFVILTSKSEEEFFDDINVLCLDRRDEFRACQARCLKELHPAFHNWLVNEYTRGTSPITAKRAIAPVLLNLIVHGAFHLSEPKNNYRMVTAWDILYNMGKLFRDFYSSGKVQKKTEEGKSD